MADFRSIIGKTLAQYRIDKLLGHGGMAAVYQATDLQQERLVALKIMHSHLASQKAFQDRFLQEASSISRLSHPNIVRIFGFDRAGGELFIVMELITGGTLRSYVKKLSEEARYMPLLEAVDTGRQLANALNYAHSQGMMHRDVKPDNVVLRNVPLSSSPTGYQPVLTDFGLARLVDDNENTDQPLGTYPYMSPEQCLGERVDTRTDIYSLGIVLYELTAGRLPFVPRTIGEAARMHSQEVIVKPSAYRPDIPGELDTIILKALAKDPTQRYQTGQLLAEDLERVMRQLASQPVDEPDRDMATDAFATEKYSETLSEDRPDYELPKRERRDEGKDRLVAYSAHHPPVVVLLKQGVNSIGAADDQVLRLQGPYVSRRHARLEVMPDDTFRVTDVGSTNGTWVSSLQINSGRSMKMIADDTLRIGDYWVWVDRDTVSAVDIATDMGMQAAPAVIPVPIPIPLSQYVDKTPVPPEEVVSAPVVAQSAADVDKTPIPAELDAPPPLVVPSVVDVEKTPVPSKPAAPVLVVDMEKTPPPPPEQEPLSGNQEPSTLLGMPVMPRPSQPVDQSPLPFEEAALPSQPVSPSEQTARHELPPTPQPPMPSEPPTPLPNIRLDSGPTYVMPAIPQSPAPTPIVLTPPVQVQPQPPARPLQVEREVPAPPPLVPTTPSAAEQTVKPGAGLDAREAAIAARRERMRSQREASSDLDVQKLPPLPPPPQPRSTGGMSEIDKTITPMLDDGMTQQGIPAAKPPASDGSVKPADSGVRPPGTAGFGRGTGGLGRNASTGGTSRSGATGASSSPGSAPKARRPSNEDGIDQTMMPLDEAVGSPVAIPVPVAPTSAAPSKSGSSVPNLVGQKLGAYRLTKMVGQGPQSSVYEAWDTKSNRPIALKVLHPNLAVQDPLRRRFIDEARVLSSLEHPNIVKVFTFETADGYVFMVMELIMGGTIRSYMRKMRTAERPIGFQDVMQIARQMADALHYAHQQGLLHRDIRPDNIVLRETIEEAEAKKKPITPVLTDFGLAKASEQGEGFATDQQGVAFQYLSPEEAQGLRADARSDIYELGTLMYELVTGQTPFQPQSMAEAIRMYSREAITRPSDLRMDMPLDLERVISRALEREATNRYQTAAEMSRALQTLISSYKAPSHIIEDLQAPSEEDLLDTVIMESPLSDAMPLYTPQPVTDEQVGFERLVIMSNNFPLRVIPMNKNLITLGRSEDQTVRLEGKSISRRHARIERGFGSQFRIIDVGSINGTYVGAQKLTSNVAEILTPDKTVRLGEYWIKIEPAAMRRTEKPRIPPGLGFPSSSGGAALAQLRFAPTITNLDDRDAGAQEGMEQYQVVRTGVKKIELPAPDHDKVGYKVINPIVTVAPGSSMTMTMEIQNLHNLVDHFVVQLDGLPHTWYTIQQAPIYLMPNNRETASITFHPPLDSKSSEGGHYFEVRVVTRAQAIKSVAVQCLLNILPFKNFITSLEPRRADTRVRPELMIRNTGNTFAVYTVQTRDREQGIIYELPGKQFSIAPGQEEFMSMRLRPRSRPFVGTERSIPFEVIVSADDERLPPQTLSGELAIRARFPVWLVGLLPLLCIICLLLSLLLGYSGYSLYTTNIANTATAAANFQTATLIAQVTALPVTATAIAESDPDGDGLSNIREKEIGSDPNKADTDEDGLNDGDEVRIWNTIPMNRDTDGDGWTDGEEVNVRGTNPLVADTDGDTIPDPIDNDPLAQPTATITPFPTLEGSNGDICAGSPPARMQVGIDGVVEPGGVPNRVRDNPGALQGTTIGKMPPGTAFRVLGGPVCDTDEQLRWWQVDSANGLSGWTAEGRGDEYYIAPQGEEGDGSAAGSGGGGAAGGDAAAGGAGGGSTNTEAVTTNPDVKALSDDVIASLGDLNPSAFDRTRMGLQLYQNNDATAWSAALDRVGQVKMGWIKVQVNWATLQPDGPGSLGGTIASFEQDLAAARARGARIMISVAKAPGWARGGNSDGSGPPDDPQTLADFLSLLLARVGTNVDAIEVWNEPNLRTEWNLASLPFDGSGYMQLFQPAYTAIRAFSPSMTIVTAGLAPTYTSERSVDDRAYLRQMYAAGLSGFLDVVIGVHPYGWGNSPILRCCDAVDGRGWDDNSRFYFLQTLEEYRSIQLENTHDVKMWITEFGWATWEGLAGDPPEPWMAYNTPVDQSNYTLRAFQLGQRLPYMGSMMLWNLNFGTLTAISGRSPFAGYSLILENGVMRPAFGSLIPTS